MRTQLAAMFCLSAALGAAQAPGAAQAADPAALLNRAATKARDAKTFRMAGVTVIEYLSGQTPRSDTVRFRILLNEKPSMARLDIVGDLPASRVCGGPKPLTYFEYANEVFVSYDVPTACYSTIAEWPKMPESLTEVKLGGTKRITIEGEQRECTVVSGQIPGPTARPSPLLAALPRLSVPGVPEAGLRSLCVDAGTGDVLWFQTERTIDGEQVRETTTFSHFEYGAEVGVEDFEVDVPADAIRSLNGRDRMIWPRTGGR